MAYFSIFTGLRGCFMPDSANIIKADTRKELKSALEWDARDMREAGYIGLSKRAIASLAAQAWRNRKRPSEIVAPCKMANNLAGYTYALGVFTGMTRQEYKEQEEC